MNRLFSNDSNKKLKKEGIWKLSLPGGGITCPGSTIDCESICYAAKQCYRFSTTINRLAYNLELCKKPYVVDLMLDLISKNKIKMLRLPDSGDYFSRKFTNNILKVAENTDCFIYSYTKSHYLYKDIFDKLMRLPNFDMIKSFGGKHDKFIDTKKDKHAKVFDSIDSMNKAGYVDCTISDRKAIETESKKIGLILR